jgi:hypothetical protein
MFDPGPVARASIEKADHEQPSDMKSIVHTSFGAMIRA